MALGCIFSLAMAMATAMATAATATATAPPAPVSGEWWESRGDRRLAARSSLKGEIVKPAIVWKYRVAARETLLSARLAAGARRDLQLPQADITTPDKSRERLLADYGAAQPSYDLDANGKPVFEDWVWYNTKLGKVLPDVPGIQRIACETRNYPDREPYQGTVRLMVRKDGKWTPKWETITDTLIWVSEPIFGDFDHDGRNEIALLPWYQLTLLDAQSGKLKERAAFKLETEAPEIGGRGYGWFGAVDLDGQGNDEFVIIDDFVHHMAVMGWRDGKLQRLWNWLLNPPGKYMAEAASAVRLVVNPQPVQDVDGDGRPEIVVSIYNHHGDQRWHTLVINALTGKVLHDLDGWLLCGLRDLDGDGAAELLCTRTDQGMRRPEPAPLAAFSVKTGKPQPIWELADASFQEWDIPAFPDKVNSGASLPRRTVLCEPVQRGGRPVFFTRRAKEKSAGVIELTCWQHDGHGTIRPIAHLTGPHLSAMSIGSGGEILLRASASGDAPPPLIADGMDAAPVRSQFVAPACSPAVVGRMRPDAPPTVVVQNADETVEAIRPRPDGSVQRLWRVPGRTMTSNNFNEGALLADLRGDGTLCAVVGRRGAGDCARIAVLDPNGKEFWHHDFDEFPGAPPPWNVPGLIYWQGGYFTDPSHMDLLVQLRRVGGETYLLDGRSGEQRWFRSQSTDERDFGTALFTIFDFNGDGREDVLTNYPDTFCVADGPSGKLLLKKHARDLLPGDPYYGSSVAGDFLGDGTMQVLYRNVNIIALLRTDGSVVWRTDWDPKDPRHPLYGSDVRVVAGDADGDGKHLELFVPGVRVNGKREMHCLDAATGKLRWQMPLGSDEKPTDPAVGDVDGDGRDECIFTIASNVYCVGESPGGKSGIVKWTLPLPNYTSSVAIADSTGGGAAQVIVSCNDGYVYGIGGAKQ